MQTSSMAGTPARGSRMRRAVTRLVTALHRWAESGWAGPAVGSWGVLQGSVVPGPADTLLAPLGLADPPRVWRLAAWAIAGSILGGLIAFAIGAFAFDALGAPMFRWLGLSPADLERSQALFDRHGWWFVLLSTITPVSTKIVCIAAGAFGVPFLPFVAVLVLGRTLRFMVIATLLHVAGARILARIERWIGRPLFAAPAPPPSPSPARSVSAGDLDVVVERAPEIPRGD